MRLSNSYDFYLFGCSHTANFQGQLDCRDLLSHLIVKPFCYGGNSNDRIVRDLKSEIYRLTDGFTKRVTNVYFNIQFTYFNRTNLFSDLEKKYIPFHSNNIMNQPFGTKNGDFNTIYNQFYTDWLTYFFNEEQRLIELMVECEIIKKLMDDFGIKYNWYLWAGINKIETINSQKEIEEKKVILEDKFQKLGFYKFDEFWYFEDYAATNKMRIMDNPDMESDEHLTNFSNITLVKLLLNIFNDKIS
jgi:hypothetical protein